MNENMNITYAIAYALKGMAVFPIKFKAKTPLTKNGFKDATKDVKQIEEWWKKISKCKYRDCDWQSKQQHICD
jgi:Bifunctional DNA primase/polymerase, N-terminal.